LLSKQDSVAIIFGVGIGIAVAIGIRCALEPHFSRGFYSVTMLSRTELAIDYSLQNEKDLIGALIPAHALKKLAYVNP
jgi:hypothetical protein